MASLRKNWLWAGVLLVCVLIAATAFVAPAKIGRIELRRDATEAAQRIGSEINAAQPGSLVDAFARPALAAHIGGLLDRLGYDHRVLRYELYDAGGNRLFSSGKASLELDQAMGNAAKFVSNTPQVGIYNRSNFVHMDCGPVRSWRG